MITVGLALAPIFLLILLGQGLKRWGLVPEAFWPAAEKLTYFLFFPALLTANLAGAELSGLDWGGVAGVAAGATVVTGGLLLALRRWLDCPAPALTSAFQGSIRPNTYVGLAGAATLYGDIGVTLTALCIAAVVPLVNALSVGVLAASLAKGGSLWRTSAVVGKGILTNPLILACLLGLALNLSGIGLPPVVGPLLEILGTAALPIGLLAVGAGLALESLRGTGRRPLLVASALKLLVLPLLALVGMAGLALVGLGLDEASRGVVILYTALPCSASAYVLARQMGGDAPLMATIITAQTLAAMATLPGLILLFGSGLLPS